MSSSAEYTKKKNAELEDLLKARGLPHTGKKAELVARLVESDNISSSIASNEPASNIEQAVVKEKVAADPTTAQSALNDPFDAAPKPNTQVQVSSKPAPAEKLVDHTPTPVSALAQAALNNKNKSSNNAADAPEADAEVQKKDFSSHLASTDVDSEIAARKRRAERFGLTSSVAADGSSVPGAGGEGTTGVVKGNAEGDAAKLEERAKRFGLSGEEKTSLATRLDSALPEEKVRHGRKRGRGAGEAEGRDGKRVASVSAKKSVENSNGNANGGANGGKKGVETEQMRMDREAAERRKARFAVSS